jgi:glycosyltransferase involved in cell wall biosynthesis
MRIAIDLRPLQIGHEYRGIGAYLTNVLGRFPFETSEHTFIFLRHPDSNPADKLPVKDYEEVIIARPPEAHGGKAKLLALLTRRNRPQFGDLGAHHPDVFFQPDFMLGFPRGGVKKYTVMYDLIPLVLRGSYLPSWKKLLTQPGLGKKHRLRVVGGAWIKQRGYMARLKNFARADRVFCISEATARDAHTLLGIPKAKLQTIPLAASVPDIPDNETHRPGALKGLKNPYIFFVGGVDERRRLADLVHAFNMLNGRGRTIDLVMSGKELADVKLLPNVEARNAMLDSSYKGQIHLLGFTSQEEKAWLLRHAFVFVYPSLYEGFGLPVLEAMTRGCPVITYRNSSLIEIAGQAAVMLEHPGAPAIRDAVMELQDNPGRRQKLVDAGRKQARGFNWDTCAQETYDGLTATV